MLDAYSVAMEAAGELGPVLERVAQRDRALADQLRRALASVVLNIAEGERSSGGNARLRFATAAGSNAETRAALRLAAAWGYVPHERVSAIDQRLDRVAAMLWRLGKGRSPQRG